jgi:hypothetical protein
VLNIFDVRRRMELRLRTLWHYMASPYLSTLAMALGVTLARHLLGGAASPLLTLCVLGAVGGAVYVAALWSGSRMGLWPAHASLLAAVIPSRWRRRAPVT